MGNDDVFNPDRLEGYREKSTERCTLLNTKRSTQRDSTCPVQTCTNSSSDEARPLKPGFYYVSSAEAEVFSCLSL